MHDAADESATTSSPYVHRSTNHSINDSNSLSISSSNTGIISRTNYTSSSSSSRIGGGRSCSEHHHVESTVVMHSKNTKPSLRGEARSINARKVGRISTSNNQDSNLYPFSYPKRPSSTAIAVVHGILNRIAACRNHHHVMFTLCMLLFPIAWITIHWNLMLVAEHSSTLDGNTMADLGLLTLHPLKKPSRRSTKRNKSSTKTTLVLPSSNADIDRQSGMQQSFRSMPSHLISNTTYVPTTTNPLPVIYIGATVDSLTGLDTDDTEENNILRIDPILDAFERSSFVRVTATLAYSKIERSLRQRWYSELTSHSSRRGTGNSHSVNAVAIVVDWSALDRDCHVWNQIWKHVSQHFSASDQRNHNQLFHLLFLDASASSQVEACTAATRLGDSITIPSERVRIAKRSIVENRRWNNSKQWVETGTSILSQTSPTFPVVHWTGHVSEVFVECMRYAMSHQSIDQASQEGSRPIDVAHYWKSLLPTATEQQQFQYHHLLYNRLRHAVKKQLNATSVSIFNGVQTKKSQPTPPKSPTSSRWAENVGMSTQREWEVDPCDGTIMAQTVNDQDEEKDEENQQQQRLNVALLVSSKIVVIAQADEWEDHDNRLMEALASGALVVCDTMAAPPEGLQHQTNIIFYNSTQQLDQSLRYYLDPINTAKRKEISRRGWEFALRRHRSWHVVETLLFGRPFTLLGSKSLTSNGPAARIHSGEPVESIVYFLTNEN